MKAPLTAYRAGYKYQVALTTTYKTGVITPHGAATDFITLTPDGDLTLARGYAHDGPSGPTFDDKLFVYFAAAHDGLYQLAREGLIPWTRWRELDKALEYIVVSTVRDARPWGRVFWNARIKWVMAGLWIAHGKAAKPKNKKPLITVSL